MTMVFAAKDKALLDKTQVGDKIRFMVINEGGKMVVTAIEPAKGNQGCRFRHLVKVEDGPEWWFMERRRTFSREFKLEAVRLVTERGVAVAQAAKDLDVHERAAQVSS